MSATPKKKSAGKSRGGSSGSKGSKKTPASAGGMTDGGDGSLSKDDMEAAMNKLKEELEAEKEERNFFQLERVGIICQCVPL